MAEERRIDLGEVRTIADFHARVSAGLSFPSYYGKNLDAFWDCLSDLSDPMVVRVVHFRTLEAELKETVHEYIDLMKEYQEKSAGAFVVEVVS